MIAEKMFRKTRLQWATSWLIGCLIIWPTHGSSGDRALLIGVEKTILNNLTTLPGIPQDLSAMKSFCRILGFPDDGVMILSGTEATRENIMNAMRQWLLLKARPEDRILIYFTGHAGYVPDDDGDEVDQFDEALFPYDARYEGEELIGGIRDDDFAELINQLSSKKILVIIDAGHAGGFGEFSNALLLGAADSNEDALATARGSRFTKSLLEVIREAEGKTNPTYLELIDEIKKDLARHEIGKGRPVLKGATSLFHDRIFPMPLERKLERIIYGIITPGPAPRFEHCFFDGDILNIKLGLPFSGYLSLLAVKRNSPPTLLHPGRFETTLDISMSQSSNRISRVLESRSGNCQIYAFLSEHPMEYIWDDDEFEVEKFRGSLERAAFKGQVTMASTSLRYKTESPTVRKLVEKRIALVISNGAYPHEPLPYAVNDGRDMRAALSSYGFRVIYVENASHYEFKKSLARFFDLCGPDSLSLFYFSGYHFGYEGKSFILPTDYGDNPLKSRHKLIDLDSIINNMAEKRSKSSLLLFDTGRAPRTSSLEQARSEHIGSSINLGNNMLVAFATTARGIALDSPSMEGGFFTQYLIKNMKIENLSIIEVLGRTRRDVYRQSNGRQIPWVTSSLLAPVYLERNGDVSLRR